MHNAIYQAGGLAVRGGARCLHTPALVNRNVHDYAARLHGSYHLPSHQTWRLGPFDQDGPNDCICTPDGFGNVSWVGDQSVQVAPQDLSQVAQALGVDVKDHDIGSHAQGHHCSVRAHHTTANDHDVGWQRLGGEAAQHLALSVVWIAFAGALMVVAALRGSASVHWTTVGLLGVTAAKILAVDPRLTPDGYSLLVNAHAGPLLAAVVMLYLASHLQRATGALRKADEALPGEFLSGAASLLLWWVLSSEAWHYVGWSCGAVGDPQQYALSAVWTLYGAALAALGLLRGSSQLRWIGIVVFAVTAAKVFFLDLQALDIVYRILALLGLGAVLVAVGFAYQRLVGEDSRAGL